MEQKNRILIVEDDTDINNLLYTALQKAGYETVQAFSGTEARMLFQMDKAGFSLILLDLMLPGISGEEVLAQIRKQGNTPVIVLTAKDGLDEKLGEIHVAKSAAQLENSYAGRMGKGIEPIIKPLGFDWKIGVGLVGAFAAKEILVSTLGIIYSVEGADEEPLPLQEILANDPSFSPLIAICLMVFSLLYCPCLAVIGVIKRETKSFKWPIIAMVYPTVLAWFVTFAIYQGGRALGF